MAPQTGVIEIESHEISETSYKLVDWYGPGDGTRPLNWPLWRKVSLTTATCILAFIASLGSSIFSACLQQVQESFKVSYYIASMGVSLYVLGFSFGPLLWGPLSCRYGRSGPLKIACLGAALSHIPVILVQDIRVLLVFRFFAGLCSAASLTIAPAIYADIWFEDIRKVATWAFVGATFAGPMCGPMIGEYILSNSLLGWRTIVWVTFSAESIAWLSTLLSIPESSEIVILRWKAVRARLETSDQSFQSRQEIVTSRTTSSTWPDLLEPFRLLIFEPVLLLMSIYTSLVYGIMYLTLVALPYSFAVERKWALGTASLPFLAILLGELLTAVAICVKIRLRRHATRIDCFNNDSKEALKELILGSFVLMLGLAIFAISSSPQQTWHVQVASGILLGCGFPLTFGPVTVYLVDTYKARANNAVASNIFLRSAMAAPAPMIGAKMCTTLGVQWTAAILASCCFFMLPFLILLYFFERQGRSSTLIAKHP